jgi:hypothetical protein
MDFLLVVEVPAQRIQPRLPELLVVRQPHGGILQRLRRQLAMHGAPFLGAHDQPGVLQHLQVLHEAGQRARA